MLNFFFINKKFKQNIFFTSIFSYLIYFPVNCLAMEFMIKPSIGIDFGWRKMPFENLYGHGHFANRYYHISPYVSLQILEYLGIQAGFQTSNTKKNLKSYNRDEKWLNVDSGGVDTSFLSSTKIYGEFVGLTFNTATFWQELIPTKIILFAGIATLKCKMSHSELIGNYNNNLPASENLNTGKKAIPKFSITLNSSIPKLDGLSVKLTYGLEKTSKLNVQKATTIPTYPANETKPLLIKLKNSSYVTIGLSYTF